MDSSICIIKSSLYDLYFPLWLNWGIYLSSNLSVDIGIIAPAAAIVATSTLTGTFANTAFFLITFAQQGKLGYLVEEEVEEHTYP